MARRDTKWLIKYGDTWHVQKAVPRPLQLTLGKRKLVRSLDTPHLATAMQRRHAALAVLQEQIDGARRQSPDYVASALAWRDAFKTAANNDEKATFIDLVMDEADELAGGDRFERGDLAPDPAREADGLRFHAIATGARPPLDAFVDRWLAEGGKRGPAKPGTQTQYRVAIQHVFNWLREHGALDLENVTSKLASDYVEERLARGDHPATVQRHVVAASSYWAWLVRRHHVSASPWTKQSVPQQESGKRAFTDEELSALLDGPAPGDLGEVIRVLACTGMRVSELAGLKVSDVSDGWLHIRDGKTKSARRKVPVHHDISGIIASRVAGCKKDALLFECGDTADAGTRTRKTAARPGHHWSNAFMVYRRELGVGGADGTSDVDMHSLRRWFITKTANAGAAPHVVQEIVGHKRPGMTLGVYHSGSDDATLKAAVASVRLPVS